MMEGSDGNKSIHTLQLNKELVRKHFDRHADEYDRHARVQAYMGNRLLEMVEENVGSRQTPVRSVLEIGCGTGNVALRLLERFSAAALVAVDLSEAMIGKTKQKLGSKADRVRFIPGDAERLDHAAILQAEPFDLIVSNATFQWFNDPGKTVGRYLQKLAPGGVFAFSTFAPNTFRELHASFYEAEQRLGLRHTMHGQPFCSGEQWIAFFDAAKKGLRHDSGLIWHEETTIENHPSVKHFLYSVKRVGAGNANKRESGSGFVGKRLLREMQNCYEEHFSEGAGIRVTYQLGFGLYKNQ